MAIFLGALAAFALLPRAARFLRVDGCLDRGGRWLYDEGRCEEFAPARACAARGGWWSPQRELCLAPAPRVATRAACEDSAGGSWEAERCFAGELPPDGARP
jgi:hypothetical protein